VFSLVVLCVEQSGTDMASGNREMNTDTAIWRFSRDYEDVEVECLFPAAFCQSASFGGQALSSLWIKYARLQHLSFQHAVHTLAPGFQPWATELFQSPRNSLGTVEHSSAERHVGAVTGSFAGNKLL